MTLAMIANIPGSNWAHEWPRESGIISEVVRNVLYFAPSLPASLLPILTILSAESYNTRSIREASHSNLPPI